MPHQYTATDQVNFLCQWFDSWSELQREDFLPILAQALSPLDNVNGLVGGISSVQVSGRRPSLFDCQVKLFHDWFGTWTEDERSNFVKYVAQSDAEFTAQLNKQLGKELPSEAVGQQGSTEPEEVEEEGETAGNSTQSSPLSSLPHSQSPHDSGLDDPQSDTDAVQSASHDEIHSTAVDDSQQQTLIQSPDSSKKASASAEDNSSNSSEHVSSPVVTHLNSKVDEAVKTSNIQDDQLKEAEGLSQ